VRRALAIAGALGLASVACGVDATPPLQAPPPPTAEPIASVAPSAVDAGADGLADASPEPTLAERIPKAVQGAADAYDKHDADAFAAYFAENATVDVYGSPEGHGRGDVKKSVQAQLAAFPDDRATLLRTFQKRNVAIVELVVSGTMRGDFLGVKASNKPVGDRRLVVARFGDDGLVTQWHEYVDVPGRLAQMKGASGAPPLPAAVASGPAEAHVAKGSPEEDRLVTWGKAMNDAMNKGDAKALLATYFAPDASATFYTLGGKELGGKALTSFDADFYRRAPKAKFEIVEAWGIDGYLVVERVVTTQAPMHVAEVIQPAPGGGDPKIRHVWAYGNPAESTPPAPKK
jgi:hypothetical protein